jgi:hypothetical protein
MFLLSELDYVCNFSGAMTNAFGSIPKFWNKFLLAYIIILVLFIMVWFIEIYTCFFLVWLNSSSFSVTLSFDCMLLIILRLLPHPKPPYIVLKALIH